MIKNEITFHAQGRELWAIELKTAEYSLKNIQGLLALLIHRGHPVAAQLAEYFAGKLKKFDVLCAPNGTEFQKRVWQEISKIPYGEVRTYKEIAGALKTKAYQAVGQACGKNPIPFVIPCHRVVASGGQLGGYAFGKKFKKELLELEKVRDNK